MPPSIAEFYEDGEFLETKALVYLLQEKVLVPYYEQIETDDDSYATIAIWANVDNLFTSTQPDIEPIEKPSDLEILLKAYLQDGIWGVSVWACIKRQMQPKRDLIERLKQRELWTVDLEELPPNPDGGYDEFM